MRDTEAARSLAGEPHRPLGIRDHHRNGRRVGCQEEGSRTGDRLARGLISQRSALQVWQGNPDIRPFVTYNAQAVYVLRGKYQFVISDNYAPHCFIQQMYLDPELEKIVYKTWNWHYYNNLSLTAVAPLPKTDWWQGRLVLDVGSTWIKLDVPFVGTVDR